MYLHFTIVCFNFWLFIICCYTFLIILDSDRIWDSPTAGDIRLTGGAYSNQGLLEVYCNDEWGTVCENTFSNTAATVACQQLGYNDFDDFDHLSKWMNSLMNLIVNYRLFFIYTVKVLLLKRFGWIVSVVRQPLAIVCLLARAVHLLRLTIYVLTVKILHSNAVSQHVI